MGVFPTKPNALEELFGRPKVLIGVIHSLALPGSPQYEGQPLEEIYQFAVEEAQAYRDAGFDGLIVENAWDLPFAKPEHLTHETSAVVGVMTDRVRRAVPMPTGVNVLANGVECSIACAQAGGAGFVRANQWVNAYIANEGFIEGPAAIATRYRARLRASGVRVFADVHVKHGSHAIVADRPVPEQATDAEFFDADVLIATGQRTGNATEVGEIKEVKSGTDLPVIIGSGVTVENAAELLAECDGAIVASSVKENGQWWGRVSRDRCRELVDLAASIWA